MSFFKDMDDDVKAIIVFIISAAIVGIVAIVCYTVRDLNKPPAQAIPPVPVMMEINDKPIWR